MWKDDTELPRRHSGEPNEIQKSINQIGYNPVLQSIGNKAHLAFCDMHGYYVSQGKQMNDDGTPALQVCPLCITHNPEAEGTDATDMELYINMRDQLQDSITELCTED